MPLPPTASSSVGSDDVPGDVPPLLPSGRQASRPRGCGGGRGDSYTSKTVLAAIFLAVAFLNALQFRQVWRLPAQIFVDIFQTGDIIALGSGHFSANTHSLMIVIR